MATDSIVSRFESTGWSDSAFLSFFFAAAITVSCCLERKRASHHYVLPGRLVHWHVLEI